MYRGKTTVVNRKENSVVNYKEPPKEKREEIQKRINDLETISVYADQSYVPNQGIYGLAAACFGAGVSRVYYKKIYSKWVNKANYAELLAIEYAVEQLPVFIDTLSKHNYYPKKIVIHTDSKMAENLEQEHKKSFHEEARVAILTSIKKFNNEFPDLSLRIEVIGKDGKRYNPMYTAAHNGSRKAIGKK